MYSIILILLAVKTTATIQLGRIQNATWVLNFSRIDNEYTNISNITCDQCLCRMLEMNNLTISIACQEEQKTCQLLFWNATAQLQIDEISVVYFQTIPKFLQTTMNQPSMTTSINSMFSTAVTTKTITSSAAITSMNNPLIIIPTISRPISTINMITTNRLSPHIFWSFDSNYDDLYNVYNGVGMNNCSFHSPGYTGYGSALSVDASKSQYVVVSKFLNMTYTSFTWEMWAYPINLTNSDHVMVGMCESASPDECLHLMIRNHNPYFAFWGDDCVSSTIININQWYHFAFVYDYAARTQYIYLNGDLDCIHNSSGPFQGNSGNIIFGALKRLALSTPLDYWTGYIDQVSYVSRAKSAAEVLIDAKLVAYYSFDNGSFYDSGPNKINGTGVNVSSMTGRVNEGILFNASLAYFQASGFTLLGVSYRPYSVALWIYKLSPAVGSGTIVHLSQYTRSGSGWCIPIIGLTSSYQIVGQNWNLLGMVSTIGTTLPLNTWTHIVTSYSMTNGVRLWINGTLVNSSDLFTYASSGVPNTITLGSLLDGISGCTTGPVEKGQFYGMMDELRIYSRELNACDVYALANP